MMHSGSKMLNRAENNKVTGMIIRMTQRDWFYRLWTKQELAVSSQDPMLMIGKASLP